MELVKQPKNTNLCGQACVATVAGISLDESIKAFGGHKGRTKTHHLIDALASLGIHTDDKLTVIPPQSRENWGNGVVSIAHYVDKEKKHEHWMVLDFGVLLDPAGRHTGKTLTDPTIAPYVKSTLTIRQKGWTL